MREVDGSSGLTPTSSDLSSSTAKTQGSINGRNYSLDFSSESSEVIITAEKTEKTFTYTPKKLETTRTEKEQMTQRKITARGKALKKVPGAGFGAQKLSKFVREKALGSPEELSGEASKVISKVLRDDIKERVKIKREFEKLQQQSSGITSKRQLLATRLFELENESEEIEEHEKEESEEIEELTKEIEELNQNQKSIRLTMNTLSLKLKDFDSKIEAVMKNETKGGKKTFKKMYTTKLGVSDADNNDKNIKKIQSQDTDLNIERLQTELRGVYHEFLIEDKTSGDMKIQSMLFGRLNMETNKIEDFDIGKHTILLFTGSGNRAENYAFPMVKRLQELGCQVMIMNPPGFGESDGKPSGRNCLISAEASCEYLKNLGVPTENIAVMGYSLGGAMAAYVASQGENEGMRFIGDRVYTSIPDVADAEVRKKIPIGKGVAEHIKPLLENIIGDLDAEKRMNKISGKKFIASGTKEKAGPELAKKKDLEEEESLTTVIFEGGHEHDDESLWFAQGTDQSKAFKNFIEDFLGEGSSE